ncbi:sigma-70 family RNA polymerase sigma factor [Microvirga sp. CF3062]|uniref:sigma-70 family RNA polymerase sigma factor n=1 Tax=Microvirga sp. CF3062 TaxID=3110182 RepID=UPI002E792FA6|nr:sigma-70 family RNA polymerase sigma factor [Microvirga sp. CF3062]MEE1656761.1 sigma-70 family RNA polymerase sigma factor [Microvirga sp. CF3062]
MTAQLRRRLSPLFKMSIAAGIETAVRLHIRKGTDVNAQDEKGRSPLLLAAARGHTAICRLLLDAGADPFLSDVTGQDPLKAAQANRHRDTELLLLDYLSGQKDLPEEAAVILEEPRYEPPALVIRPEASDDAASVAEEPKSEPVEPVIRSEPPVDEDELDLSGWEAEEDAPAPDHDPLVLKAARDTQTLITVHAPVDTDEDWSDIEISLPEVRKERRLQDPAYTATRSAIRFLISVGLDQGSIPVEGFWAAVTDPETGLMDEDLAARLQIVLDDLRVAVDEWVEDQHDQITPSSDGGGHEEPDEILDQAFTFFEDLDPARCDPLNQYLREVGTGCALPAEKETALFLTLERSLNEANRAIASCPFLLDELVSLAAKVETGQLPLQWAVNLAGDDDPDDEGEELTAEDIDSPDVPSESSDAAKTNTGSTGRDTFIRRTQAVRTLRQRLTASRPDAFNRLQQELQAEITGLGLTWRSIEHLADAANRSGRDGAARDFLSAVARARSARERILRAHLKLVVWQARRHNRRNLPLTDVIQEGNLGLMRALELFDYRRGNKFSSYAMWWVKQAIHRFIADNAHTIRLPVHMFEAVNKLLRTRDALIKETGCEPRPDELAEILALPLAKVKRMIMLNADMVNLDDLSDAEELQKIDRQTEYRHGPPPLEIAINRSLRFVLTQMLLYLEPRAERVLRMRMGLNLPDDHTLEEVGQQFSVTRERIRQIEAKALKKLAHPVRAKLLRDFLEP